MDFLFRRRSLRILSTVAIAVLAHQSQGQKGEQPILVANDVVNGPTGNAHTVEDLKVFASGRVSYTVRTKATKSFTFTMKADDATGLVEILDSPEIRKLPKEVAAKAQPVDFFWDQNFQIVRSGTAQDVHIEHFYPFLNLNGPAYPEELIAFECKLQDIKASATKESSEGWCEDLLAHNLPESQSYKCNVSESEARINAGSG